MLYSAFWVEEGMVEINQMGLQAATGIPRPNVINLFPSINYKISLQARVFVPGKLFQPSLMFLCKA